MKSLLLTVAAIFTFGFLTGCASNTGGESPATAQQPGETAATDQSGGQVVDVKSPDASTGQNPHVQNPGAAGASKMISPLTQ